MKADKRHILFLQLLKESAPKERRAMLNRVGNDFYKLLTEIIFNLLHGNVPVSNATIHHLARYKGSLRTLSDRTVSFARKRTLFSRIADSALFHLLIPIITMASETYYNEADDDDDGDDSEEDDNVSEDDDDVAQKSDDVAQKSSEGNAAETSDVTQKSSSRFGSQLTPPQRCEIFPREMDRKTMFACPRCLKPCCREHRSHVCNT